MLEAQRPDAWLDHYVLKVPEGDIRTRVAPRCTAAAIYFLISSEVRTRPLPGKILPAESRSTTIRANPDDVRLTTEVARELSVDPENQAAPAAPSSASREK